MRLAPGLVALCAASAWAALASPPPPPVLVFAFDAAFGDNMVLQQAPAKAAVYGFVDFNASMAGAVVRVTLIPDKGTPVTLQATLNATAQTFGPDWGVRPCASCPDIDPPFNPFLPPTPLASWKVLLPPMPAGGNYTVTAECIGCSADYPLATSISNVAFGDMWYCTGQSNMWLPVLHTYQRNETAGNISAGEYSNIRLMAGTSGNTVRGGSSGVWPAPYGGVNGSNAWMTAAQAAPRGCVEAGTCPFFDMGATCWYFAQGLADLGVSVPIGIVDTAIGGQHIEEFMINHTIAACTDTAANVTGHDFGPWGNAQVFGSQVIPFVDMTIKGFVWYQGENNMGFTKGNSDAGVGYSCLMRELINGYRRVWSATPNTTDPLAPFGAVALPSGGSEGGPNMGAMRIAQTAGHGVLPTPSLPNTWIVQAYDLEDQWGSGAGPCFSSPPGYPPNVAWSCCPGTDYNATSCAGRESLCAPACTANADTATFMGGIHPRSKKPVGQRLARGAFNTVYGGTGSITGPTLSSCAVTGTTLAINFDASLLRGDTIVLQPAHPQVHTRYVTYGGTLLWALTNASTYCIEPLCVKNVTSGGCAQPSAPHKPTYETCPVWAGGDGVTPLPAGTYSGGWVELNYTVAPSGTGLIADLSPLNGSAPVGIRYAWDSLNCCDLTDPTLYVTHDCLSECPVMSSAGLPANPFHAKIVDGACQCQPPQQC